MSYSKVRTYFNQVMNVVDPNSVEWTGALVYDDAQNIPDTIIDKSHHIEIGPISSSRGGGGVSTKSFLITLTIFKRGYNNPTDALDYLIDKAEDIECESENPKTIESFKDAEAITFEQVNSVSITPSEIEGTNDNTIKCALEFNITMLFYA